MGEKQGGSSLLPAEFQALASLISRSRREIESTVNGVSMSPTIPHGARIKVCPPESPGYHVGQIVVCVIQNALYVHRIVYCGSSGRVEPFVLTQGDGWLLCDPPVRKSAIIGVVKEFSVEGAWHVAAEHASRRPWRRAVAATHVLLIRSCLAIHHQLARRVSEIFFIGERVLRRGRSTLAIK